MPGVNVLLFGLSFVYGTAALNCFGHVCPTHEICEVIFGDKSGHCKHKGNADHETCPVVTHGHCFCEYQPCIDNMKNQFQGAIPTGLNCFGHVCPSNEICEAIIGDKSGHCKYRGPADHETCPVVTRGHCFCEHQPCIDNMKNQFQGAIPTVVGHGLNCFGHVCPSNEICEVIIGEKYGHCKHKLPADHETCPVVTHGHCLCEHQSCIDYMILSSTSQSTSPTTAATMQPLTHRPSLRCGRQLCPDGYVCEHVILHNISMSDCVSLHSSPACSASVLPDERSPCYCNTTQCNREVIMNLQNLHGVECNGRKCPYGYVCVYIRLPNLLRVRCTNVQFWPACSASVLPTESSPCYCSNTDCNREVIRNLQNLHAVTTPLTTHALPLLTTTSEITTQSTTLVPTTQLTTHYLVTFTPDPDWLLGLTLAPAFFIGLAPAPVVCADADTDSCEIITKLTTNFCTSSFAVTNCAKSCKICTTPSL